jgi:SagB-type dehydrogenase family enzyme
VHNDPAAARAYHERTKHSPESVAFNRHRLLWDIQPLPFKIYETLEPIPLPRDLGTVDVAALDAIARTVAPGDEPRIPGVREVARAFQYSAGITKERVYAGGQRFYFRAAACTGALYHIDLYLVCGDLPGIAAGVYHFGPHDFALRTLRAGDFRGALVAATAEEPAVACAPAIVVATSTFWRNAWKYQERAYRHCWWDSGTLLANFLAVAAADDLPARVVLGFVDVEVNRLLGLDAEHEAALALVTLGHDPAGRIPAAPALTDLNLATRALSIREVDYPAIRAMHEASSLPDAHSVRAWREQARTADDMCAARPSAAAEVVSPATYELKPLAAPPDASLDRVIRKRGSTRRFSHEPIAVEQLATLLERSLQPVPFDFRPDKSAPLDAVYLIVNAMDGVPAGSYALALSKERAAHSLVRLREGSFRREAGHLGLGQDLPADAAADVWFLGSLDRVLSRTGARGYRALQLEAAIHGGRAYLAAYALGLGATGLTFFDDDVTRFFSPHAVDQAVLFFIAVGKSRRS